MSELINIARAADGGMPSELHSYVDADEIWAPIDTSACTPRIGPFAADADIIGKRVVGFQAVFDRKPGSRPGSGTFLGFQKFATQYVVDIRGKYFGDTFGNRPELRKCYYYVREA